MSNLPAYDIQIGSQTYRRAEIFEAHIVLPDGSIPKAAAEFLLERQMNRSWHAFRVIPKWNWIITGLWGDDEHATVGYRLHGFEASFCGGSLRMGAGLNFFEPLTVRESLEIVWCFSNPDARYVLHGFFCPTRH